MLRGKFAREIQVRGVPRRPHTKYSSNRAASAPSDRIPGNPKAVGLTDTKLTMLTT